MFDEPLPHSTDAEQALLECVLIKPEASLNAIKASCPLLPSDFYHDKHRIIWRSMGTLLKRGEPIDLITVKEELVRSGSLESVGSDYLSALLSGVPDLSMAGDYARIIREMRVERGAVSLMLDSYKKIGKVKFDEVYGSLKKNLDKLAGELPGGASGPVPVTPANELVKTVVSQVEWQRESGVFFTGIPTGYEILDSVLGGWQRGVLHVLGAYTSHSKTASLLDFSLESCFADEEVHALYFALEMTELMMGRRLLAAHSGINLLNVKTGDMLASTYDKFIAGAKKVEALGNRWAITDSMISIDDIERVCTMAKASSGLDVVFCDYLQLIEDENEHNREREVNKVGKRLLDIAKKLDIAVVASAQLNEGVLSRKGHRPLLTDLRESRAINQHARTVILLSRPWLFERTEVQPGDATEHKQCTLMYFVDKNSEGELGEFTLHYNVRTQKIIEESCGEGCPYYDPYTSVAVAEEKETVSYEQASISYGNEV